MEVLDADGHIIEGTESLAGYIDPSFRDYGPARGWRSYYPTDSWDRSVRGRLGERLVDASGGKKVREEGQMAATVLYPTNGLGIGWIRENDFAVALCKAYNDFFYDQFTSKDSRLKGVALLPLQDIPEAIKELQRATQKLGMVGAMLPAVGLRKPLGHEDHSPLYEQAQRLGIMLASHATVRGPHYYGADVFDRFIEVHTLSHAFAQMTQFASMVFRGVPEKFPSLRLGFMEAGCTWLPFWLDRMDEEWEKRGELEAPLCRRKPSEYVKTGNLYFSVEAGEKSLPEVVRRFGDDVIVFASDVPHWDSEYPENLNALKSREDLPESSKVKILSANVRRLYNLALVN
jgi:predicted TIM-barrel fold metal-dependent hydrolase